MNESCSTDCKVTEPLKLSKGKESMFYCSDDKGVQEGKTVRSEMQHSESFSDHKCHEQA